MTVLNSDLYHLRVCSLLMAITKILNDIKYE